MWSTDWVLYDQLVLSDRQAGTYGDCARACVCTLLQVDPSHVPHSIGKDGRWNPQFFYWLLQQGYVMRTAPYTSSAFRDPDLVSSYNPALSIPRFGLGVGMSPRNIRHAVVWDRLEDRMIHDPHPSRSGLLSLLDFDFLLPVSNNPGPGSRMFDLA